MRLFVPNLLLFIYLMMSLVWPLPFQPEVKTVIAVIFFIISMKSPIHEKIGDSFIAPSFPVWLLVTMELLYNTFIILIFILFIRDTLTLMLWISRKFGMNWHLALSTEMQAAGMLGTAVLLAVFGFWQSIRVPEVKTVTISLSRLPIELEGFSIVQLTDLHIGSMLKKNWLQKVVTRTNELDADLIVLTGDMIDGTTKSLAKEIQPVRELKAKYGVYGVTGNHEYYFDTNRWLQIFKDFGIEILDGEFRTFDINGKNLVLAGVPDSAGNLRGKRNFFPTDVMETLPQGIIVLLQHQPFTSQQDIDADLQLSGHTHGGHLFFLKPLIAAFNSGLAGGLYDRNGRKIYVSAGTGVWAGFSCRLGIPSEITRITLKSPVTQNT